MSVGLDHRFTLGTGVLSLTTLLPLVIAIVTCLPAYALVYWDHGARKSLAFVFGMVSPTPSPHPHPHPHPSPSPLQDIFIQNFFSRVFITLDSLKNIRKKILDSEKAPSP